jgi:hypothetical protein
VAWSDMGNGKMAIVGDDTKLARGRQPLESREAYKAVRNERGMK